MQAIRAITVCVDFYDFLAVTLPVNIHHFSEYWVVTSMRDEKTTEWCQYFRDHLNLPVFIVRTDLFYRDGAVFNKYRAMEMALDVMERKGWLCILDADVIWPKSLGAWQPQQGYLYTPFRYMLDDLSQSIPAEKDWSKLRLHGNHNEFAGYSQIFHADDPELGPAPWHQTNWRHAGGGDSFFQLKWPPERKVRPPWRCLHLGRGGEDWCGRVKPYLDGTQHPQALQHQHQLASFLQERRRRPPQDRFAHEKLPPVV